jgi:hypothetical protein
VAGRWPPPPRGPTVLPRGRRALPHVVAAVGSRFLYTISGHGATGSSTMARGGPLPQARMEASTSASCEAARGSDGAPPSTPTAGRVARRPQIRRPRPLILAASLVSSTASLSDAFSLCTSSGCLGWSQGGSGPPPHTCGIHLLSKIRWPGMESRWSQAHDPAALARDLAASTWWRLRRRPRRDAIEATAAFAA